MKKVSEGIYERQKNKDGTTSYLLQVMSQDHRYNKTVRCTSLAQATKARERFRVEIEDGKINYGNIKWPELCDLWLDQYARIQYKTSTYEVDERRVQRTIKPIWKKQIKKITRADVQKWVNAFSDGHAQKTVKNHYSLIHIIFKWAVQKDMLSTSPCLYIDLPRGEKTEAKYLDLDTFQQVVALLPELPLVQQALFHLAMFGGMRRGEIMGLMWDDVDLDTGIFFIHQTRMSHIFRDGEYVGTPKTASSVRRGALPQESCDLLRSLKEEQDEHAKLLGNLWPDTGYIIIRDDGEPVSPNTVYSWVQRFVQKHDLPHFSLHSLRHTHASLLRYLGADIDEIQKKLGHSDKATTEYIYTHMFEAYEKVDREMAGKIDELVKSLK